MFMYLILVRDIIETLLLFFASWCVVGFLKGCIVSGESLFRLQRRCSSLSVILLVLFIAACCIPKTLSSKCDKEAIKRDCLSTEYHNYVDCIRSRIKRSTDCDEEDEEDDYSCRSSCENCDCDDCGSNDCKKSCTKRCFNRCSTNHCCHKVCHNSCETSSCRSSCRRSCYKTVRKDRYEGKEKEGFAQNFQASDTDNLFVNSSNLVANRGTHNITTVIHLNNLINNTNLIDVPINLNNSNVNNITVENSDIGGTTSSNYSSSSDQCCKVVEPRQCVPSPVYPFANCFHYRRDQCGSFCRASQVHKVVQNVCYMSNTPTTTCGQQVIYVPQPQYQCGYSHQWPYISCSNQGANCDGCYDYLLNPYRVQRSCSPSCFNYGMSQGAAYQQGPVLSPGYSFPLPLTNPMYPPGCSSYGGCGSASMGTFINPGMYYGMNPYNNYGIYGSYTPYGMPTMQNLCQGVDQGGNSILTPCGMGNSPLQKFIPTNSTPDNLRNVLYGIVSNSSSPSAISTDFNPGWYGQPIVIDEETLKKILSQPNLKLEKVEERNSISENSREIELTNREIETTNTTTTEGSLLFGR